MANLAFPPLTWYNCIMNDKLIIMTCPYCGWSASHVESETERKNRLIEELIDHLGSHKTANWG